jgi:3,4-dihydroxy 2-butanone 4-phosphate synthase/GTP cyclohydrolase II
MPSHGIGTRGRTPRRGDHLSTETTPFATVEEALEDIASGKMVVVVDDEDRENEGDLVMAAEFVTADDINFMATHARGWICLALTGGRCDELGLELMSMKNETAHQTPFTVTIEAREGVTTGISAADRAHTIHVAVDPTKGPDDIVKGGHVNPLKARPGGVLERTGHTEASIDLARLAGCIPAGVICEIMNEDGSMARVGDLQAYCFKHGLRMITIADLIAYRRRNDRLVERVVATRLPTTFGDFEVVGYRSLTDDKHHVALVKGEVRGAEDVLVRMHSECLTGDVFHSLRCDCGEQLESALAMIEREGRGVVVYLAQEGRGIGLLNKLRAYKLQEEGLDTVDANLELGLPADLREYGIGAQILVDLGLSSIRILTNNPKKIHGLQGYGLSVTEQVPIHHTPNPHNEGYLRAKAERMGHTLHHQGLNLDEEMLHLRGRLGEGSGWGEGER